MSRFLATRSCNDDYVPFRVTREANIEYVMNDNNTTDANMYFRKKEDLLKAPFGLQFDLQFEDPRLAAIDARLEHICAMEEARFNNDGEQELEERPPFYDETQHIFALRIIQKKMYDLLYEYFRKEYHRERTGKIVERLIEAFPDELDEFMTNTLYLYDRADEIFVALQEFDPPAHTPVPKRNV